jgi:hypothetical protein
MQWPETTKVSILCRMSLTEKKINQGSKNSLMGTGTNIHFQWKDAQKQKKLKIRREKYRENLVCS